MLPEKAAHADTIGSGPSGAEEALRLRIDALEAELRDLRRAHTDIDGALPAREALLREAEKIAHLGSWFLDPTTNETKWSEELFRILGYDPALDSPRPELFFGALHPDDLPRANRIMENLAATGKMVPADYRVVWKDGTVREIHCDGTVVLDGNGRLFRVVGTVLDVTDRKHLEEQLRQSQKMEVVGRLAGGVAHDFNNLLTVITGNADLLLERSADERALRIRDAAEVGAALTRQLLAFSRQAVVKPSPLDLNEAIRDMIRILERLIGEDVGIKLELTANAQIILADLGQVQQILLNLAVNARDAMPGGGELTFTTREGSGIAGGASGGTGRWVDLLVRDTGKGMDARTRERAMEPFFTTKEPGKGTGLGLSTIADVVAQMRGSISIASAPDRGTTVAIRFARHDGRAAESPAPAPVPEGRGGEAILLVEDNPDLRELLRLFLDGAGYQVQAVGRPGEAEALWKTRGGDIDLLIADMIMPEKSGLELSKAFSADKPSLKTLFISGYSPSRKAFGESAFLQKPFARAELLQAVRALLDKPPALPVP